MADLPVYPDSELDTPNVAVEALGSFWSATYQGSDLVRSLVEAVLEREAQENDDLLEVVNTLGVGSVAIRHTERWQPLTLLQSQMNDPGWTVPKFGEAGLTWQAGSPYRFGGAENRTLYAWPLPRRNMVPPLLFNRITAPSRSLVLGIDYVLQGGYLVFRNDPFADDLIPQEQLFTGGDVTDQQLTLWACRPTYDQQRLYRLFGYVLGLNLPSSGAYKTLLGVLLDAIVRGTTAKHLRKAWSAITGVPVAVGGDTVQQITSESDQQVVVSDQAAYILSPNARVTVSVGDVLSECQSLCDALVFCDFNTGATPAAGTLWALALGQGFLTAGFFGDLVFQNADVPLVVSSDDDGYTKISWEVDGWPSDVDKFFDELHARGRATGQTLAHLLDQRPVNARNTEPMAGALPATINPLQFLCQNVLRNNATVVVVRPAAFGAGCGMDAAKILRTILSPGTAMLVVSNLSQRDTVTLDGPGDETTPGYNEQLSTFVGNSFYEQLGTDMIVERVRLFQIGGRCV